MKTTPTADSLLFVVGPTAVGKTGVAIELALLRGGEILSVDARQIYRRLYLGTAKPTAQECGRVPHHLLDLFDPAVRVTAVDFAEHFHRARQDLAGRGVPAIAAGGSGLYVDACLGRLNRMPPRNAEIRARHETARARGETEDLYRDLQKVDPASARRLSPNDFQRISRALEVFELTGRPMSRLQTRTGPLDLAGRASMVLLLRPRAELFERIEARADAMIAEGLLEEVRTLLEEGLSPNCPAFESIGYAEFARVLRGETALREARETFVHRTRRYAKRQITWFRNRYRGVCEVELGATESPEQAAVRIEGLLAGRSGA